MYIFVVEDSLTQATEINLILSSRGFNVKCFNCSKKLLEYLNAPCSIKPDIIITNIIMPEMNGYELCAAIKEEKEFKEIPVILLTSLFDPSEIKKGLASGADSVITKTYNHDFLISKINTILTNRELKKQQNTEPCTENLNIESITGTKLANIKILLAEDSSVNQKVAIFILNNMGFKNISVANDGREAIEQVKNNEFDLILMDMQMPIMDGFTATKHIRKELTYNKQPKIIAMTANTMEEVLRNCFSAGMDDYLSKPITSAKIIETLKKHFAHLV